MILKWHVFIVGMPGINERSFLFVTPIPRLLRSQHENVKLHAFLTSALDGCEWSASRPGRFTPGTHRIGAEWTSDSVWTRWRKGNIYPPCPCQASKSERPARSLVSYTDWIIPAKRASCTPIISVVIVICIHKKRTGNFIVAYISISEFVTRKMEAKNYELNDNDYYSNLICS
jgi:hypothetical protein